MQRSADGDLPCETALGRGCRPYLLRGDLGRHRRRAQAPDHPVRPHRNDGSGPQEPDQNDPSRLSPAAIEVMENRGRDVRPFLVLLETGRLERYRYVCKVHGKKSSDGGRMSYIGALWRRRLLFDLLAAPGLADSIVEAFERGPLHRHDRPARLSPAERRSIRRSCPGRSIGRWCWNSPRRWEFGVTSFAWISSAELCSGSDPRRWRPYAS